MKNQINVIYNDNSVFLEGEFKDIICNLLTKTFNVINDTLIELSQNQISPNHAIILEDKSNAKNQILVIFSINVEDKLTVVCESIHLITNTSDSIFVKTMEKGKDGVNEMMDNVSVNLLTNLTPTNKE